MTAHPAKRTGFVVALAVLSIAQFVAVAHGAPVPNLVLTCSDENAIGQEQSACHGIWAYQIQADPLIVSSGSLAEWSVFGELIGADTVYVCTLPVEPGQYSSCRDASGVRRMALVRKDSLIAGGTGGSVTVDKIGGDYTDPVTAAANAFAGDTWCVAPQWPGQPCVMAIGDGVFILNETLRIPEGLVVAGLGKGATMLVADNGVETAVSTFGRVRVSDLTIVNSQPGGARTTGIDANGPNARTAPLAQLHDVAVHVAGGAQNVAVVKAASLEILDSTITAVGQDAIGIALGTTPPVGGTRTTLERSHISATTALDDHVVHVGQVILTDSHVFGEVVFGYDGSLLEITRSEVTGSVSANGRGVRIVITGSSIKGEVCAC